MIEVFVDSIRVNITNQKRVVMLKEKHGQRSLPMWVGHFEADSIAIPMQNVPISRPLTHDLLVAAIPHMGATWARAVVSRLEAQTFYAVLVVEQDGREVELDCRPSDAVAVAIRAGLPMYVEDAIMEQAGMVFDDNAADAVPADPPPPEEAESGETPA